MTTAQFQTRQQRAQQILDAGQITPEGPGQFAVKSQSDDAVTYHVELPATCPCPDHAKGFYCKHLIAAKRAAEIMRRPRSEWYEELDAA